MSKPKFVEGEKILCFHGPLLYEAKCLNADIKEGQMKYYVHYQGWKKNWDEWVTEARIMKFNAVGLQKQKELKDAFAKSTKKLRKSELKRQAYPVPEALRKLSENAAAAAASDNLSAICNDATEAADATVDALVTGSSRKRKDSAALVDANVNVAAIVEDATAAAAAATDAASVAKQPKIIQQQQQLKHQNLILGNELKLWLADDYELINFQFKLLNLPMQSSHTVAAIIHKFVTDQSVNDAVDCNLSEFGNGLIDYFNIVLGSQLLYKFERPQFAKLLKLKKQLLPADIYGFPHLLRMLVHLQKTIPLLPLSAAVTAGCDHFIVFLEQCQLLASHLEHNSKDYVSTDDYEVAEPHYQRLALCS